MSPSTEQSDQASNDESQLYNGNVLDCRKKTVQICDTRTKLSSCGNKIVIHNFY